MRIGSTCENSLLSIHHKYPGKSVRSTVEKDVPGTLRFLFAGGAEPSHCPLRTTCCSKAVYIETSRDCGVLRIANLDHIHDNSIERNQ